MRLSFKGRVRDKGGSSASSVAQNRNASSSSLAGILESTESSREAVAKELAELQRCIDVGKIEDARNLIERVSLIFPDRESLPQDVRALFEGIDAEWRSVMQVVHASNYSRDADEEWEIIKPPELHPYGVTVHRRHLTQKSSYQYRAAATYSNVSPMDFARICCLLLETEQFSQWFSAKVLKSNHVLATPTIYSRNLHTIFSGGRDAVTRLNLYFLPERNAFLFNVTSVGESSSLFDIPHKPDGIIRLDLEVGLYMKLVAKNTYRITILAGEHADSASDSKLRILAEALDYLRKAVQLCPGTELESNITKKKDFYKKIIETLRDTDRRVSNEPQPECSEAVNFQKFPSKIPTYLVARLFICVCLGCLIADQFVGSQWTGDHILLASGALVIDVIAEIAFYVIKRYHEKKRHDLSMTTVKAAKAKRGGKGRVKSPSVIGRQPDKTPQQLLKEQPIAAHGFGTAEGIKDVQPFHKTVFRFLNVIRKVQKSKAKRREKNRDKRLYKHRIKMLLLGAGSSGKSTVFKQMRILYGAPPTKEDSFMYKNIIRSNVMVAIKKLVVLLRKLKLENELADESKSNEDKQGLTLEHAYERICRCVDKVENSWEVQDPTITNVSTHAKEFMQNSDAVQKLWDSHVIKQVWAKRDEMNVIDGHKDFLCDIPRIVAEIYKPTMQDIILARVRTTQASVDKFIIKSSMFQIVDVGGQRLERKSWSTHFDTADAVIFVAALSEYDQQLEEYSNSNRMVEALGLFRSICENSNFENTPILLFLNKRDLFVDKIFHSDIAAQMPFADYSGPAKSYDAGLEYFHNKFISCTTQRDQEALFVHVTCATDTENMEFVLDATQTFIMRNNLTQSGFMD